MKKLVSSSIVAMIATAPITAQDKDVLRFGINLSYVIPAGDFSNIASTGLGVGVFGEKPLTDNFSIRGTVDYTSFGGQTDKYYLGVKHDVSLWGITADGIWSFTGHDVGPYDARFYITHYQLRAKRTSRHKNIHRTNGVHIENPEMQSF